ncbi:Smr/MutS family protein [Thalassobaculum sp.]|uniref:Smr/MutS family protein n=1 Tax=Thalassobaculum sp. TaxID=2022740 RepID=UPI0032EABE95
MTRRPPTPDELELFGRVMAETKPLKRRRRGTAKEAATTVPPDAPAKPGPAAVAVGSPRTPPSGGPKNPPPGPTALSDHGHGTAPGIDRRTQLRLKRGQLPIEARIDLHGLTREKAHAGLNRFLARQDALGRRCVLVITGKGRPDWQQPAWGSEEREIGVIRRALPGWLDDHPNKQRVLAYAPAQPQDGGSGAWYVLLRRRRDDATGDGAP